nr:MAG TPA: hypothetical protein [Caudoviricetes sp.]
MSSFGARCPYSYFCQFCTLMPTFSAACSCDSPAASRALRIASA